MRGCGLSLVPPNPRDPNGHPHLADISPGPAYTRRMGTKSRTTTLAILSGLSVAALSLFSSLWVNGNIPVNTAIAVSLVLGLATSLAMRQSTPGKSS